MLQEPDLVRGQPEEHCRGPWHWGPQQEHQVQRGSRCVYRVQIQKVLISDLMHKNRWIGVFQMAEITAE